MASLNENLKVRVKDLAGTGEEALTCIVNNSFYESWEVNSTYELQFTAFDDGSLGYQLLTAEATVTFNGQQYIIKQLTPDASEGIETTQVVADHIYNECSRIYQHSVKSGELTYSPKDVLAYFFDGNTYGFTYDVKGTFENDTITDLGNCSAKDGLSKVIDTWSNAIIFPDNKNIVVYSLDEFYKDYGNRIDYIHDSREVQLEYDSNDLVNQMMVYGKEKESDSDTDSTTTEYYFTPHLVTDEDSVKKWGLHPGDDLSDERFTDAANMDAYAKTQMVTEPSLSISVTMNSNDKPIAGETRRLEIRSTGYTTTTGVVAFQWYPFDSTQNTTLTMNNTAQTILDYQANQTTSISKVLKQQQQIINNFSSTVNNNSGTSLNVNPWSTDQIKQFTDNLGGAS